MRNIKLLIQYDGTRYHGWQIQSRCETVQGHILHAIQQMVGDPEVKFVGASRTDAGVHALGQVGNFWIPDTLTLRCESFYRGLNSMTPEDIVISQVEEVAPAFHARFDACGKTYCYQIMNAPRPAIYHQRFAWHIRHALDVSAMRQAAAHLLGCHDFAAFQASSCSAETSIRTVFALHIRRHKQLIRVFIRANAYLHYMVRNIVGTLVEVGLGRKQPAEMLTIREQKDRTLAGVTAPAQGLFLLKVSYQEGRRR